MNEKQRQRVAIYAVQRKQDSVNFHYEKVKKGEGTFCEWGLDTEEVNETIASFSAAIVKMDDGSIALVYAKNIKFL